MAIAVGQAAPDFTLQSTKGEVNLAKLRGEKVVLLFFPFAFSGPCSVELTGVRDQSQELPANVIGISVDSLYSLKAWDEQHNFGFPLASDFQKDTCRAYGVLYDGEGGRRGFAMRSVFVVDREGIVRYVWVADEPTTLPDFDQVRAAVASIA
jgi:peroxiredoxin